MTSVIYTSIAIDATPSRESRKQAAGTRHLPPIGSVENGCTGNCEQGRRCSCALSSGSNCDQAEGTDALGPASAKEVELLSQMSKLLAATLGLSLLAWVLA